MQLIGAVQSSATASADAASIPAVPSIMDNPVPMSTNRSFLRPNICHSFWCYTSLPSVAPDFVVKRPPRYGCHQWRVATAVACITTLCQSRFQSPCNERVRRLVLIVAIGTNADVFQAIKITAGLSSQRKQTP